MATTLWDTSGGDVVRALLTERRAAGALASGLALSLVVVVDEKHVQEAETAATVAAAAHPCRLLIVVRRSLQSDNRLDAEVQVGGRLGPTEAVVMRMYGRLTLHAESVVLPVRQRGDGGGERRPRRHPRGDPHGARGRVDVQRVGDPARRPACDAATRRRG